jgi:hypothetical protein
MMAEVRKVPSGRETGGLLMFGPEAATGLTVEGAVPVVLGLPQSIGQEFHDTSDYRRLQSSIVT